MAMRAPVCRRDWASLAAGPAGQIAERLLAIDVADYVRFRASLRPETLPERIHLRKHPIFCDLLGPTAEGLLILCQEGTLVVQLLNPLTGQLTDLPRFNTLPVDLDERCQIMPDQLEGVLLNAGLAESSMVALHYGINNLAVAKPGDKNWTRVDTGANNRMIVSALSFAGRFYCATADKVVPKLVVAANYSFNEYPLLRSLYYDLVENDGELMLTTWYPPGTHPGICQLYRVDLDAATTVAVSGVDERAVFVSSCGSRALSVPVGLSPSISAGTVYCCKCHIGKDDEMSFVACSIIDGRIVEDCRTKRPCSIVSHISRNIDDKDQNTEGGNYDTHSASAFCDLEEGMVWLD
ncbi:hypothetical protein EJB05_11673, partial [Eragrostis curvula]